MGLQQELDFNPDGAMDAGDVDSVDLGDHQFEVDMLEAEGAADGAETEPESESEPEPESESEPESEAESGNNEGADETDAAEETPEASDALADPTENPLIPRERLNQANRKRQEEAERADNLQARVTEMEAAAARVTDDAGVQRVDPAVLREAAEKVLDGDTEAFSNMLAEQFNNIAGNGIDREALLAEATQNAVDVINANTANTERQNAADNWVAVYPELDHTAAGVNQEALDEAIMLSGMYEEKGYAPGVAMERAVKAVAASHDLKSSAKVAPITPIAKKTIVKKTARTVNQPAGTGAATGEIVDKPAVDLNELSQDEWDALPESTRDSILNG